MNRNRNRNRILALLISVTTLSLLWTQLADAEINVTPPPNWQPSPTNNSTVKVWIQNSTLSVFGIIKPQLETKSPLFPLLFPIMNPLIAQSLADQGVLESTDQTTFGKSNYGYRYFLNLSLSSLSNVLNSSHILVNQSDIPAMLSSGHAVLFKGMLILTLKQGDFYGIFFLSPRENFDSKLNEIKPTIDSIQLSNSTAMVK